MTSFDLPPSYAALPTKHIKLSHVPADSTTPTKVILVTLNRPEKNNAFTSTMADELSQAFRLFDVDDRVRAVVVTGAGKMFCAGADLDIGFQKVGGDEKSARDHRDRFVAAFNCA